mgnify:CR=1 FL=1
MKKTWCISAAVFLIAAILLAAGLTGLAKEGGLAKSGESAQRGEAEYLIYIENNDGGSITVDREKAKKGETVTISITENPGYQLAAIYLGEEKLEGNSFEMPDRAVVLTPSFVRSSARYGITAKNSRYGRVLMEELSARAGNKVAVDYYALNGYVLDYVTLNGEKTELDSQNAFTMPGKDVVVSAVFKKAIEDTDVVLKTENVNSDAVSYWYFRYTPSAFQVTVKVIDATVIGTGEAMYQDYAECIFSMYQEGVTGWQPGKTVKYTVTAGGEAYMQTALTSLEFSKAAEVREGFTYSVTQKRIMDKDGYSGYEVQMEIPYELLETTYQQALGNILVCPASRNSESLVTRKWKSACSWFDVSTHYRVSEDGSIAE